jgi:hypothetical protein
MARRQQIGLGLVLAWTLVVVAIAILTHKLVAFGLLGLSAVIVFPFRKR